MADAKDKPDGPEYEGQNPHEGNPARSDPSRVPPAADEALEEVRAVRAANERRVRERSTTLHRFEVPAVGVSGNEDVKPITGQTADGRLFINTHGEKVLDQDGVANLQRELAAAFQAVS